jgi:uncharacterized metal-binding protein YceD (DUF177 family)
MPLLINTRHLEQKELHLQDELSVAELDLGATDELVKTSLPLRYDLTVRLVNRNILVDGELKIVFDCECSRCLKPFHLPVTLPDWTLILPLDGEERADLKNDFVDLTPFLREDILLEFPQHPLCEADCAGLPDQLAVSSKKTAEPGPTPNASAWIELNKLKF